LKQAIGFAQPVTLNTVAIPCGEVLGYSIGKAECITSETERYFVKNAICSASSLAF
jgi:hypothetical protein